MKNLMKFLVLISGVFLYPFGCEAQTNGNIPCDPIIVEDPKQQIKIDSLEDAVKIELDKNDALLLINQELTDDKSALTLRVTTLTDQKDELQNDINGKQIIINNHESTIETQTIEITTLNTNIEQLNIDLAEALSNPDVIYKELDSITVNGVSYKVDEIEQILPNQTIDTIQITTCFEIYENKMWFHAGEIDVYPHIISFPTKQYGMTNVQFNDSLTIDMKKYQNTFTVKRIRDHKEGVMKLVNLKVDPATYMP